MLWWFLQMYKGILNLQTFQEANYNFSHQSRSRSRLSCCLDLIWNWSFMLSWCCHCCNCCISHKSGGRIYASIIEGSTCKIEVVGINNSSILVARSGRRRLESWTIGDLLFVFNINKINFTKSKFLYTFFRISIKIYARRPFWSDFHQIKRFYKTDLTRIWKAGDVEISALKFRQENHFEGWLPPNKNDFTKSIFQIKIPL